MDNFVLSCCSTADLSKEHLDSRNISYICFSYFMDGVEYKDDLGVTISSEEFYQRMVNGADTKTSQINIEEYKDYFTSILSTGKDLLHISLSSGLSGSYRSACNAAQELREMYPDRKLIVIDSLAASSGYGLIVDKLADMRDKGNSMEEIEEWIEEHKLEMNHWFFSTDLTFFIKGGRVSKTSGMIGGILEICPLLNMDFEGKLIPRAKIRTKRKVFVETANKMEQLAKDGFDYNEKCFLSHSNCLDDANQVVKLVEEKFKKLNGKVMINKIGSAIGSHTGPGTVALFFWGKKRED